MTTERDERGDVARRHAHVVGVARAGSVVMTRTTRERRANEALRRGAARRVYDEHFANVRAGALDWTRLPTTDYPKR